MLEVTNITLDGSYGPIITDVDSLTLSFSLSSDREGTKLESAKIEYLDKTLIVKEQTSIVLSLDDNVPFLSHSIKLTAISNYGEEGSKTTFFMRGRGKEKWDGKWLTDNSIEVEKKKSPRPLVLKKTFKITKKVESFYLTTTAIGIYDIFLNGKRVNNEYFLPGFTSYPHTLSYNIFDISKEIKEENEIIVVVASGWATGRFTYENKSGIIEKREAFLFEGFATYKSGEKEKIVSDSTWLKTAEGPYKAADFYDGEVYDSRVNMECVNWLPVDITKPHIRPNILASTIPPVIAHEVFKPISVTKSKSGKLIYDFSQNASGVISFRLKAKEGQKIIFRHAEALMHGEIYTASLRTAKAEIVYIAKEGEQEYSPRFTYMGCRYVEVEGIEEENISLSFITLYSDIKEIGSFSSNLESINRLQKNVEWSAKSNFVSIPTDCPQRDERMGWTGDAALFSSTATFNFDMTRFFSSWLRDMRDEQGRGGGIPIIIPKQGSSVPVVAVAVWSDVCILVPYAVYNATGDRTILEKNYAMMKRYLKAVKFWTHLSGFGKRKNIWKLLYQYGDWCAPEGGIKEWMANGKYIATAFYFNSVSLMEKIASTLNKDEDSIYYHKLKEEISASFVSVLTDKYGRLKRESQSGYVLPLYFNLSLDNKEKFASRLNELVIEKDYHLSTGFPGTPYLLFALFDNGYQESAMRLLLQDTPPSWLYAIKMGGTTTWEQWTVIKENGDVTEPSLNHYAYGAVGDFLYRRILGLEAKKAGYKEFVVKPYPSKAITSVKGGTVSPYGEIKIDWQVEKGEFLIYVVVPVSTECTLVLPSGKEEKLESGKYRRSEKYEF